MQDLGRFVFKIQMKELTEEGKFKSKLFLMKKIKKRRDNFEVSLSEINTVYLKKKFFLIE